MTDKLGQEIIVGSYIVYGQALGRSAGLCIGKVLTVLSDKLRVIGVDDRGSRFRLKRKPGFLHYPCSRVIVLSAIPASHKEVLDSFTE